MVNGADTGEATDRTRLSAPFSLVLLNDSTAHRYACNIGAEGTPIDMQTIMVASGLNFGTGAALRTRSCEKKIPNTAALNSASGHA